MMKKNRLILIIALVLGGITIYFFVKRNSGTIRKELFDFAVKDTASITRIFLADRNNNIIKLDRNEDQTWTMNDSLLPDHFVLKNLLEVIYKLDVRTRVAKTAYDNVVKGLAQSGIKCEIYLHGSETPEKIYYVGHETQDQLGTFMMLEKSNAPFVMQIPGFNGYLTPRYTTSLQAWKTKVLIQVPSEKIKTVTFNYPSLPDHSFRIEQNGNNYKVSSPVTGHVISKVDPAAVENYLMLFKVLYFENYDSYLSRQQKDSLIRTVPVCEISIEDLSGKKKELSIFPMPQNAASLTREDSLGVPLKYDTDHMYAQLRPGSELVSVQHYSFDRVFRSLEDFDADRKNSPIKPR